MVQRTGTNFVTHFVMKGWWDINITSITVILLSVRDIKIKTNDETHGYPTSAQPTHSLPLSIFSLQPH